MDEESCKNPSNIHSNLIIGLRNTTFNPVKPCTDTDVQCLELRRIVPNPQEVWLVGWGETDSVDPDSAADLVVKFLARGPRDSDDQQARIGLGLEFKVLRGPAGRTHGVFGRYEQLAHVEGIEHLESWSAVRGNPFHL